MPDDKPSFAAALLRQRPLCIGLSAIATAHLAATALGFSGWVCPLHAATGVPCPGCGLTGASVRLLRGEFFEAMRMHPFAPVAVLGMGIVLCGALLPRGPRDRLLRSVERLDCAGRSSAVVLVGLVVFWVLRLALDSGG